VTRVAGADGCRGGWLIASYPAGAPDQTHIALAAALAGVAETAQAPARLLIDMPVGLLTTARPGGRACDRAARAFLRWPRSASVFSPPARAALHAHDYSDALARNRATAPDAPGISRESFHLLPRLREVDAWMTPERQQWAREGHPEVSFARMNARQTGGGALRPGKRTPAGRALRIDLLRAEGFRPDTWQPPRGAAWDDVLDAAALAWSAEQWLTGRALTLPEENAEHDAHGLTMTITA
jgi:predicted RNase H-like nuclease